MNIDYIRHAYDVERYHAVRMGRAQNIGHHSANVAMLCRWLLGENMRAEVYEYALLHDVAELVTGDVNGVTKAEHPKLREALDEVEAEVMAQANITLPELTDDELLAVHAMDRLELVLFAVEDWRMGNTYAHKVISAGIRLLKQTPLPNEWWERINALIKVVKDD